MTIPIQRTKAVMYTEDFLKRLACREIKRVPKAVREEANRLLRHYPSQYDLTVAAERAPGRWGKP
jgi:hypothetical protein